MKTASLPPLRVAPRLRKELEAVLGPDETISSFVEEAVRARITWRRTQLEFLEKGLLEGERVRRDEDYVSAAEALARLDVSLGRAREKKRGRKRA